MLAFSTKRTSGFATNWALALSELEKRSKPSRSKWLPSARRNGKSTTMDARNGYAGFDYRCDKWENAYRALYTRPNYDGPQGLLEFARPDNIIVTNLAAADLNDECLIYHHHQRGGDELPHRGLKEFGSEELPFKRFGANQAFYYVMVIGFFLFETFKQDNLQDILPISSYATTVRRRLVDIAAKVVRTGGEIILKVPKAVMERLKLDILWTRCHQAPLIPAT